MAYKGKFKPNCPEKYAGNATNIVYRSLWERRFMVFCDKNDNVLEWGSEEVVVPYVSPIDGKMHRYFVDFLVKVKNKNGIVETLLIEVKPKKQCRPPKPPKNKSRKFLYEVKTWGINSAKWEAAMKYSELRGWKFKILTEDTLLP
ncbi:TPA: head completion protein [Candidatus Woesearchaeota archaeon]|nr:head completion protein [Candidatus Woesearchaeota archaeon]|tara:strand:- start:69 stop:503 length:435 start_codon:yes stop_codon:yes gene_type:complete